MLMKINENFDHYFKFLLLYKVCEKYYFVVYKVFLFGVSY